jgi:hypothetical protein
MHSTQLYLQHTNQKGYRVLVRIGEGEKKKTATRASECFICVQLSLSSCFDFIIIRNMPKLKISSIRISKYVNSSIIQKSSGRTAYNHNFMTIFHNFYIFNL